MIYSKVTQVLQGAWATVLPHKLLKHTNQKHSMLLGIWLFYCNNNCSCQYVYPCPPNYYNLCHIQNYVVFYNFQMTSHQFLSYYHILCHGNTILPVSFGLEIISPFRQRVLGLYFLSMKRQFQILNIIWPTSLSTLMLKLRKMDVTDPLELSLIHSYTI